MGDRVDHRTDVFALGVVLYELTTGARCFAGKSDFERMLAVVRGEYHQPGEIIPDFPVELEQVIRCALSIDASQRYPSASALIEALERVLVGRGWNTAKVDPIVREMQLLFGLVPSPITDMMKTEIDLAAMPIIPLPPPKRRTQPRMARGTEHPPPGTVISQLARGSSPAIVPNPAIRTVTGWAPAPTVVDDDQPTRGRYTMRRPPTSPGDYT